MSVSFDHQVPTHLVADMEATGIAVKQKSKLGTLCNEILWQGEQTTVFAPEKPRTPGHLIIAFNAKPKTFTDVTADAYQEMHTTIAKVHTLRPTQGFVVCHQERQGQYLVEILPERPTANGVKNLMDKISSNRHTFCPENPHPDIHYDFKDGELTADHEFWREGLQKEAELPKMPETKGPWVLQESHHEQAGSMVRFVMKEEMEMRGGDTVGFAPPDWSAVDKESTVMSKDCGDCAFCRPAVLAGQKIVARDGVHLLYNLAGGTRFLIVPDEHKPKVAYLSADEITAMYALEQDLVRMLKVEHPGWQVVTYCQDAPSVGQTVRHMHRQVQAYDPGTILWEGSVEALRYLKEGPNRVTREKMDQMTAYYRAKLQQA